MPNPGIFLPTEFHPFLNPMMDSHEYVQKIDCGDPKRSSLVKCKSLNHEDHEGHEGIHLPWPVFFSYSS